MTTHTQTVTLSPAGCSIFCCCFCEDFVRVVTHISLFQNSKAHSSHCKQNKGFICIALTQNAFNLKYCHECLFFILTCPSSSSKQARTTSPQRSPKRGTEAYRWEKSAISFPKFDRSDRLFGICALDNFCELREIWEVHSKILCEKYRFFSVRVSNPGNTFLVSSFFIWAHLLPRFPCV